jgi:cytochrome d ubiquinol oxidase subunit I
MPRPGFFGFVVPRPRSYGPYGLHGTDENRISAQTLGKGAVDHILLSRLQFAFTAMFHILWPVLTVGLSLFLVWVEFLWLRTGDLAYRDHAKFWGKIFFLNVTVGAATGIPMEFQFGTNWGAFSVAGGDVFGHLLGFEAAMAFMLEASFLGVMLLGWERVSPRMHLFATAMVALGASLSAFWIMDANSWMQTPTGGHFVEGRFVLASHMESIFNPDMVWGVSHMWAACLEISLFVIGGVSAWYLRQDRHPEFFLRSFKMAAAAAVLVAPVQIFLGDGSGRAVFEHQPAKLAGIEAHWKTNPLGEGAPWHVLAWPDPDAQRNRFSLDIPYALSLITTRSFTGRVPGLKEFPRDEHPPIWLPFYAFRVMIAAGLALVGLAGWTLWAWWRGRLTGVGIRGQRKLLGAWMAAVPVSYLAMEAGWVTREVGRQPWLIYGVLRTGESATALPAGAVGASLAGFAGAYLVLTILFLVFLRRILVKGPTLPEFGGG